MAELGFGLMRLPLKSSDDQSSVDMDVLKQMVDAFMDAGLNYFDTAYMYHDGMSERAIGEALVARYPRDSFRLSTKMPIMMVSSAEEQERVFSEQLERCGVDYFDNYLVHNVSRNFYHTAQDLDTFGFLEGKKEEGRIRRLGFSFHDDADFLVQVLDEHPDVDFIQFQVNYLDMDAPSIESRRCLEIARSRGIPVIVMEPVKGGALANVPAQVREMFESEAPGMSPASWAIRFAASQEGVETVLSGMSDMSQMSDNLSFMKDFKPLDARELEVVSRAKEIIERSIAVPCTSCRYCMKGCPKDIPIAEYFALYNNMRNAPSAGLNIQVFYYRNYSRDHGKASDCIGCGRCEKECPQHLPIREYLKEVASAFESQ